MIDVRGITKRYRGRAVVSNVTFRAAPGQVTGFLGPNGAGKSTTLRMVLGLIKPATGRATILGRQYRELDHAPARVGALLDAEGLPSYLTGRRHLDWYAVAAGIRNDRIDLVLDQVGLTDAADTRIRAYSLGMRQRLGLACALLADPEVLILDEPVNGLDPAGIRWIRDLLKTQAAQGKTVLLSSHLLAEVEQLADRLILLKRGTVVADQSLRDFAGRDGLENAYLDATKETR